MMPNPQIGTHIAGLNLFREADGKYYITVASAKLDTLHGEAKPGEIPHDTIIRLAFMGASNSLEATLK